jgi:uncharacterized coiled-coil protein SlyX
MRRLRLFALAAVPAAALILTPGAAAAASVQLKGQVVGTPYPSGARTAIPVLFTKGSAEKARLKSPLGVAIRPAGQGRQGPGWHQPARAAARRGQFRATSRVSRAARTGVYPRITLTVLTVTQQSKTLSAEELGQLVTALRRDLNKLSSTVGTLTSFTLSNFAGVRADIAGLRADLTALRNEVDLLKSQLTGLSGSLTTLHTTVQGALGDLANLGPLSAQLTGALADIASLQGTVGSLLTRMTSAESAIATLTTTLSSLGTTVSGLATSLAGLSSRLTTVEGCALGHRDAPGPGGLTHLAAGRRRRRDRHGRRRADDAVGHRQHADRHHRPGAAEHRDRSARDRRRALDDDRRPDGERRNAHERAGQHERFARQPDDDGDRAHQQPRLAPDDRRRARLDDQRAQRPGSGRRRPLRPDDPRHPARQRLLS